jgi:folate-binding Fe-S cluster repair protein YgfZ
VELPTSAIAYSCASLAPIAYVISTGQVTINVLRLAPGEVRPACVTTAKGKLCADASSLAENDALVIDADAVLNETLPARLNRYIVADDVTINDVTGQVQFVHLLGPAAARMDLAALPVPPGPALWSRRARPSAWDRRVSPRLGGGRAEASVLDEPLLESLRIEAGIPRWGRELDEDTLPPEAGSINTHIDYDKVATSARRSFRASRVSVM